MVSCVPLLSYYVQLKKKKKKTCFSSHSASRTKGKKWVLFRLAHAFNQNIASPTWCLQQVFFLRLRCSWCYQLKASISTELPKLKCQHHSGLSKLLESSLDFYPHYPHMAILIVAFVTIQFPSTTYHTASSLHCTALWIVRMRHCKLRKPVHTGHHKKTVNVIWPVRFFCALDMNLVTNEMTVVLLYPWLLYSKMQVRFLGGFGKTFCTA